MDPLLLAVEWLVVFALNVVPAFAPPTWILLSFFYVAYPQNIFVLILAGVTASTAGRFVLAKLSSLFAKKFSGKDKKQDLEFMREKLSLKPKEKFIFAFLFALSPLPSNALFIAVGAIGTRLREVLTGFFIGRIISYLFLVFTTEKIVATLASTVQGGGTIFGIIIEVLGFVAIIVFFKYDWTKFLGMPKHKSPVKWKHLKNSKK